MTAIDWGGQRSNMMILTGSTKSLSGLEQITGRVFRSEFPTIIDLVDDNRICKRHWTQRRKWYEDPDRNGVIHYIEMRKDEGAQGNDTIGGELDQKRVNALHNITLERARAKMSGKEIPRAKLQIVSQ